MSCNAIIVGGTFDYNGGKASRLIASMADGTGWECVNGGNLSALTEIDFKKYGAAVWMPNIDNAEKKILPDIKKNNPGLLLISSKRAIEKHYTPFDVVSWLPKSRSSLGIMIDKPNGRHRFRLLDPIGNQYCNTTHIEKLSGALLARVNYLSSLTRIGSKSIGVEKKDKLLPPAEFVRLVREYGDEFSKIINGINSGDDTSTERITRCCYGFPAFRGDSYYLVSPRSLGGRTMEANDYIAVHTGELRIDYYGDAKPTVDAPIQVRLFNYYKSVNYMIHGHVSIEDAPTTRSKISCGYIEEVDEIKELFPSRDEANFSVCLKGHGFLIMARDLGYLQEQKSKLEARRFPEP
ncbi:MAG: hypothetical protein WC464_00900 [Bdellovibrionales bacterium]